MRIVGGILYIIASLVIGIFVWGSWAITLGISEGTPKNFIIGWVLPAILGTIIAIALLIRGIIVLSKKK